MFDTETKNFHINSECNLLILIIKITNQTRGSSCSEKKHQFQHTDISKRMTSIRRNKQNFRVKTFPINHNI